MAVSHKDREVSNSEIWLAEIDIGRIFPSGPVSSPVTFCGEKVQTKMQKILTLFFMEVPKSLMKKKSEEDQ